MNQEHNLNSLVRDHTPSPKTLPPMITQDQRPQYNERPQQLPSLHSLHMMHHPQNDYPVNPMRHNPYENIPPYHMMQNQQSTPPVQNSPPPNNTSCTGGANQAEVMCLKKRKINKMACVNCSKLHKKCDGDSPVPCTRCATKGLDCVYQERRKRGPKTKRTKCGGGFEEDDFDCTDSATPTMDYRATPLSTMDKFPFAPTQSCRTGVPTTFNTQFNGSNPFSIISSMLGVAPAKTTAQLPTYDNQSSCQMPSYTNTTTHEQQPTNERIEQSQPQQQSNDEKPLTSTIPSTKTSECRTFNLLICVTGSVAAIKLPELISCFLQSELSNSSVPMRFDVRVALTDSALHFCPQENLKQSVMEFLKQDETIKTENPICNFQVYTDKDEWNAWNKRGDPVTHIDLKKWADVLLIAPLDANTLAKIANGLCDNLVTCVCRAWELHKPFIVCPAMNTTMWTHPFTKKHLDIINRELGVVVFEPVSKTLMCGDNGVGAMASVESIYMGTKQVLQASFSRK
jgi:phosphopantothenoylcysteine decarboxylase